MPDISIILALAIVALTLGGLIAQTIASWRDRRAPAPLYQDPQRAETDAWADAYPEN